MNFGRISYIQFIQLGGTSGSMSPWIFSVPSCPSRVWRNVGHSRWSDWIRLGGLWLHWGKDVLCPVSFFFCLTISYLASTAKLLFRNCQTWKFEITPPRIPTAQQYYGKHSLSIRVNILGFVPYYIPYAPRCSPIPCGIGHLWVVHQILWLGLTSKLRS